MIPTRRAASAQSENRFSEKIMLRTSDKVTRIMLMQKMSLGIHRLLCGLRRDDRGNAAVEFAIIVPIMLTLFFGTIEFSSGVAVDRKITLVARTLSDLTSQSTTVTNTDMAGFTITAKAIMTPYDSSLLNSRVSELYVEPTTLVAKV